MNIVSYKTIASIFAGTLFLGVCMSVGSKADEPVEDGAVSSPGISDQDLQSFLQKIQSDTSVAMVLPSAPTATGMAFGDAAKFWAGEAKKAKAKASTIVSKGDPNVVYDIVVQLGHFPRTTGRTGGTGKVIVEQEATSLVGGLIADQLASRNGIKYLFIEADNFVDLKTKVFISLHTDSTGVPSRKCKLGPSVGYTPGTDSTGMHMIAYALATSLNYDVQDFMKDSYTKGLAEYYAYSRIDSTKFKGVLEMTELSCEKQEENFLANVPVLAKNLATALEFAARNSLGAN